MVLEDGKVLGGINPVPPPPGTGCVKGVQAPQSSGSRSLLRIPNPGTGPIKLKNV